ncbi:Sulphur transport domain containing protein [Rhabdaerophilaceae bacterium]
MSSIAVANAAVPARQLAVVLTSLGGLILLMGFAGAVAGVRQSLLAIIGFLAGLSLYHASFGFTAAWRRMLNDRRSLGIRAQIIMLGVAILAFFPLLGLGTMWGQSVSGFINPVGVALVIGAFLFGIGMQLGGGCGSGTLFTVGGGSSRMVVTLVAFIAGSTVATADPLGWMGWPTIGSHSLVETAGWPLALILAIALLAGAFFSPLSMERSRHGVEQPLFSPWHGNFLHGPWPLLAGALALAAINIATLLVAGRPWGITAAFALWGAKFLALIGTDVASWPYWRGDSALSAPLLADATSVMNFGIMLGALAAAGLAGKFAPARSIALPSLIAAVIGGLVMGIGARLATGCNIGAFFSGTASGSLHGLVWLLFAIPGNAVGVRLRPLFKLDA